MKKLLFSAALLFLAGCSNSQNDIINTNNNNLTLTFKEKILLQSDNCIYKQDMYLPHINIYQYIYKEKNQNCLAYEYIYTSDRYRFTKGLKRTIAAIFKTNDYILEGEKKNLSFFILHSKSEDKIYLIAEMINGRRLKLLYGLDELQYEKIKKTILEKNSQASESNNTISHHKKVKCDKSFFRTFWNPELIIMQQIVSRGF
jgi:hypothetical protein